MATSGSITSSSYSGSTTRAITLSWTRSSYSIANNTSTISWTLKGSGGNTTTYYKAGNFKVVINGSTVYSSSTRICLYNGTTVSSGSLTITHGSDGSKTFSASIEAGIYNTAVNCTGSGSFTLDTIPRVSVPTLSSSSVYFGSSVTITTNRKSTSFTHKVYYSINGGSDVLISSSVGASYGWTVPSSLMSNIPSATSTTIKITVYTMYSGSSIGSNTVSFTAKVPTTIIPTCSLSVSDNAGYYSTYGYYIQSYSKLKITVSASGSYSSTIKSYSVKADGKTYTSASTITDVLINTGSQSITVTVTDSRGRTSTTVTKTISVLSYSAPVVSFKAYRCNASGTEDQEGLYFKCELTGSITSLNSKNSATYKICYKKSSDTTYTTISGSGTTYTSAPISCSAENIWNVYAVITDNLSSTQYNIDVPIAFMLGDVYADGKGVSFGKIATRDGFDCQMNAYFTGDITFSSGKMNDYIVEQGTSGIWVYRKWASGLAECWGVRSKSVTCSSAWYTLYTTSSTDLYETFPTGLFSTVKTESFNVQSNYSFIIVNGSTITFTTEHTSNKLLCRTNDMKTTAMTVTLYWGAKGTWK